MILSSQFTALAKSPENHLFGDQKVKGPSMSHTNIAGMGLCTIVRAGFF